MLTLTDILEALTGKKMKAASLVISEAAIDSRQVIPGGLFVALSGEHVDGHEYIAQAFQRGANLVLVQKSVPGFPLLDIRPGAELPSELPAGPFCLLVEDNLKALQTIAAFWRAKMNVRVIGITGSVGKSTTKELVAEVISQRYRTLKNSGNLNNEIGLPLTLLRLSGGHERAVLEMGFFVPGEIAFLCDLAKPSVGIITNIGTVHAERAGSQEIIALGKSELVQALPASGTAILNLDDPLVAAMAQRTSAHVFFYGLNPQADLWADEIESHGLKGISMRLHYRNETLHIRVPLLGRHAAHTVLRAAAAGLVENLSWQEIITGLQTSRSQLRLVAVHTENGALILDDSYNASPESTLAALNLFGELEGRRIAVLGEMYELGQYENQGHEMVGVRAAEVAHILVAVGEKSKITARAARQAGMSQNAIIWVNTVSEAINVLKPMLHQGDVALVKGSHGLRMDQIVSALEAES